MSNFWNSFPKVEIEGVISYERPFDFKYNNIHIDEDLNVNVVLNGDVNQELLLFIAENGLSASGNSYILNPKSVIDRVNTRILHDDKIIGFALSIPHSISLNNINIKTGLTTNLCVSLKHRKVNLAKYLISSIIDYGYNNQIYTGYHFISQPRTSSNIHVYNFFRPLNIEAAKEYGYQIPKGDYILNRIADYSIKKSNFEDFQLCEKVNRYLNINFEEKDFINQLNDAECLTIFKKNTVVGVCIFKTILVKIAKTGKICPVARMVYMECIPNKTFNVMSQIINYMTENKKHAVISGVCLGNLTDNSIRRKLGILVSGESYLDFYNIHINESKRNSSDVNVLYV